LENLPPNTRRTDALDGAQIAGWWAGTGNSATRTASVYLRALLLTVPAVKNGRPALADVDFRCAS
jgi:hypothetical protein